jgi:hypothetical protein
MGYIDVEGETSTYHCGRRLDVPYFWQTGLEWLKGCAGQDVEVLRSDELDVGHIGYVS